MCERCENKVSIDTISIAEKLNQNDDLRIHLSIYANKENSYILSECGNYDEYIKCELPIYYCPYCGKKLN